MLVSMVPFLTMAQKRTKKDKSERTEKSDNLNASYQFMVITGRTMMNRTAQGGVEKPSTADTRAVMGDRMKITFDFGGLRTDDAEDLSKQQYRTMAHAVNTAARLGWEFVSSNIQFMQGSTVHYYYMSKQK